jgi:hypothetical protein
VTHIACVVCQADTDAALCRRCTDEIESALAELPADLADLQAVATGQAAGPIGLGDPARQWDGPRSDGALGDARWVFAPGAADQLWAIGNTLSTWIRHLCEQRGLTPPAATRGAYTTHSALVIRDNRPVEVRRWRVFHPAPDQPVTTIIGWLLTNLDAIRLDEAAAQIHDELTALPIENRRWIMLPPPEEEFHGLCDAADVAATLDDGRVSLSVGRCGTRLWSREGAQRIDCPVCGASYSRAERQTSMLAELVDTLGTVRQVASTLTTLGRSVTVKQIDHWVRRGMVANRGGVPKLVRVGDVLAQRAALLERAAARRKRTVA